MKIHKMINPPYLASVEITRRCNNRCVYCHQEKTETDLPVDRFSDWLDDLAAKGFKAVAVGGGEPTLHPDLPGILNTARQRGFTAGLTTNAQDPELVIRLADEGLLRTFGVSAGKGRWTELAPHPRAIVNLLLLKNGLPQVMDWAIQAIRKGAGTLLLLGYKGIVSRFRPETDELSEAFLLLTRLGRKFKIAVAADDYTRRRLCLTETCGNGFIRIDINGITDKCCFSDCEYR